MLDQDLPAADSLEARLISLSFLSQAQVRLLDMEGNVLADSGNPANRQDLIDLSLDVTVETEINAQDSGDETEKRITKSAIILRKGAENLAGDDGHLTKEIVISATQRSNIALPGLALETMLAEDEDILKFSGYWNALWIWPQHRTCLGGTTLRSGCSLSNQRSDGPAKGVCGTV